MYKHKEDTVTENLPQGLYRGISSCNDDMKSEKAVIGSFEPAGSKKQINYVTVQGTQELAQAMEVNTDLDYETSIASVKTKLDFIKQINVNQNSIIILFEYIDTQSFDAIDVTPKSGIELPTSNGEMVSFFEDYGDSYLSTVSIGGAFYAAYTFHSKTVGESTEVKNALKAKGITSGVFNADIQLEIESVVTNASTSFNATLLGYSHPASPVPTALDDLTAFYSAISKQNPDSAEIINYDTTYYSEVPGIAGKIWSNVKDNCQFVKTVLLPYFSRAMTLESSLNNTIAFYKLWPQPEPKELPNNKPNPAYIDLDGVSDSINQATLTLSSTLMQFLKNPTVPATVSEETKNTLSYYYEPAFDGKQQWLCGGDGGGEFPSPQTKYDTSYYLNSLLKLKSIRNHNGNYIDHIWVSYEGPAGNVTVNAGGGGGGSNGANNATINFEDSNPVTGITGWERDNYTETLFFRFQDKTEIEFGSQHQGGGVQQKQFTLGKNQVLVGFIGNSGDFVDKLIALYATILSPIKINLDPIQ